MWLHLEVGSARVLRRQAQVLIYPPPPADPGWPGRRALVVEAAHTLLPEADLEGLPALAAAEVGAGLGGSSRLRIASTASTDPALAGLRDDLVARLGGSADTSGALRVVDDVYTGRLVRQEVPPIVTAACLCWYGHWRSQNGGPSLAMADALHRAVQLWTTRPASRGSVDAQITALAHQYAGDHPTALEDAPI